ncbi:MAG: DEAD/DEAH box helicase [Armatimonadota bacterium]|nr:DEAD/DEAH box helicase [Armatimonadota bacterium]
MELVLRGERIVALSRYEERHALKAAGFRWDPEGRYWWTTDPVVAARIRGARMDHDVANLIRGALRAVEASAAASSAYEPPCPPGLQYLPFQKAGIKRVVEILRGGSGALLADEMGLGKTVQALGVVNVLEDVRTVLVVCPLVVRGVWEREIPRWLTRNDVEVDVVHYERLVRDGAPRPSYDLLVVDEAHFVKNRSAKRSQAVRDINARRRLYLTGTPLLNRPAELFPLLQDLDPARWTSFWAFAKRYCNPQQVWAGRRRGYVWSFDGASNLEELQHVLRASVMVRRRKADVLRELPPKVRTVVELDVDASAEVAALHAYEEDLVALKVEAELAKARGEDEWKEAVSRLRDRVRVAFSEISEERHRTALRKVPLVVQYVQNLLEQEDCVVVWAHHHDVVDALARELPGAVVVDGRTPTEARDRAVADFQEGRARVFIGGIRAAGVGITLTRANHAVFAELDWTPAVVWQAEDRCHRVGQDNTVWVHYLVARDSLDARIAHVMASKVEIAEEALDAPISPVEVDSGSGISARKVDSLSQKVTDDVRRAVVQGLHTLCALDQDRARWQNAVGWNRVDSRIGHYLASLDNLTPRQVVLAAGILKKYRRQLPEEVLRAIDTLW